MVLRHNTHALKGNKTASLIGLFNIALDKEAAERFCFGMTYEHLQCGALLLHMSSMLRPVSIPGSCGTTKEGPGQRLRVQVEYAE